MKKLLLILLLIYYCHFTVYTQPVKPVTISGHITGNKEKRVTILLKDYFAFAESYTANIDANGDFSINLFCSSAASFVLNYSNAPMRLLYVPEKSRLHVHWQAGDFINTIKAMDPANNFLIDYQRVFPADSIAESLFEKAGNEMNENEFLKAVSYLNEQQFDFLRKHGNLLDKESYQRIAYDIFYGNLFKIRNSPLFEDYSFAPRSRVGVLKGFPFITLMDISYDSTLNSFANKFAKSNPGLDSNMVRTIAAKDASMNYIMNFSPINTKALVVSSEYRYFLYDYFFNAVYEISYRNWGNNLSGNIKDFAAFVRAVVPDTSTADWLIANNIFNDLRFKEAAKISSAQIEERLSLLTSDSVKQRLREAYNSYISLRPGMPAPAFIALNSKKELVSLESFPGKYVFIEFWDSNCLPCITSIIKHSASVAEKYKSTNVVILYISLDEDENLWKRSLAKYKPAGVNLRAALSYKDDIVKNYKIVAVPRTVIINPDGTLKDAQGPTLYELLSDKDWFK